MELTTIEPKTLAKRASFAIKSFFQIWTGNCIVPRPPHWATTMVAFEVIFPNVDLEVNDGELATILGIFTPIVSDDDHARVEVWGVVGGG